MVTVNNGSYDSGRKVNRRKFLTAGASAAAAGFAGCTGDGGGDGGGQGTPTQGGGATTGTPTPGTTEFTVWFSFITEQGDPARQLAQDWKTAYEKEANASITIKGVPYAQLTKQFRSAQAGGNVPHAVEVLTNPVVMTAGSGMRTNPYFEGSHTQEVIADSILDLNKLWGTQASGEEGTLMTWPLSFLPYIPVWRMDWLKQAGYSRSDVNHEAGSLHWTEDVEPIFKDLMNTELGQQNGHFPSATGMKQSDMEYQAFYSQQFGGSITGTVNRKGNKATINSAAALEAYKMQKRFIENGMFDNNSINMGDEEATTKHWNGQIAENHIQDMGDVWSVYQQEQTEAWNNRQFAFGQAFSANTQSTLTWLESMAFMENAFENERQKEVVTGAFDFWVKEFSEEAINAIGWTPVDPSVIANAEWFGQSEIHKDFWRGAVQKTLKNSELGTIPAVPGADAITYDIPRTMWVKILQQGVPIEQAANEAAKEINSLLAEKGRR